MNVSELERGGTAIVAAKEGMRRLTPTTGRHSVELENLQIDLRLSPETLSRMSQVDQRTARVFATSARFAFR